MSEPKRTPLVSEHEQLGARMVDFAGWYMPVMYAGINEEHACVRNNVGLFDVSHMGEVWVSGEKSLQTLQWLTTNDVSKLKAGEAQYNLLGNEQGGLVDDIFIYCVDPGLKYLVCVNAANVEKDFAWMTKNNRGATIVNESEKWGQIAVQGPKAMELVVRVLGAAADQIKQHQFTQLTFAGTTVYFAKTGYTGEVGGEIFVSKDQTVALWRELLSNGKDLGVQPIGLGARDTLRLEMKYSLYGHEITDETSPIEARLGWAVKFDKGEFIGREHMLRVKTEGTRRELIGFKMSERGIARDGYPIVFDNAEIGRVTSGTMSPTLGEAIGVGYVTKPFVKEGSEIFVSIRGRPTKAVVVKTPFVKTTLTK